MELARELLYDKIFSSFQYWNLGFFISAGFSKYLTKGEYNEALGWLDLIRKVSSNLGLDLSEDDNLIGVSLPEIATEMFRRLSIEKDRPYQEAKLNSEIIKSSVPIFNFDKVDEQELKDKIKRAHRNTVRMILKILAYQNQEELLPENWEIEHILPQKWQSSYFPSNSEREVKELVEHIGNKIPFEKKTKHYCKQWIF